MFSVNLIHVLIRSQRIVVPDFPAFLYSASFHIIYPTNTRFQLVGKELYQFFLGKSFDAVHKCGVSINLNTITSHEDKDVLQNTILNLPSICLITILSIAIDNLFQVSSLLNETR